MKQRNRTIPPSEFGMPPVRAQSRRSYPKVASHQRDGRWGPPDSLTRSVILCHDPRREYRATRCIHRALLSKVSLPKAGRQQRAASLHPGWAGHDALARTFRTRLDIIRPHRMRGIAKVRRDVSGRSPREIVGVVSIRDFGPTVARAVRGWGGTPPWPSNTVASVRPRHRHRRPLPGRRAWSRRSRSAAISSTRCSCPRSWIGSS